MAAPNYHDKSPTPKANNRKPVPKGGPMHAHMGGAPSAIDPSGGGDGPAQGHGVVGQPHKTAPNPRNPNAKSGDLPQGGPVAPKGSPPNPRK